MEMDLTLTGGLSVYLFVFARLTGMIIFNPILSRRNVPSILKNGFILMMTMLLAPVVDATGIAEMQEMDKVLYIIREVMVGGITGMVFIIFYYMLFFAGDFVDMQLGLSMAKVFDPSANIQMSITGTIFSLMFIFYFFSSDSHLTLIRIFATSFDIVPLGGVGMTLGSGEYIVNLFIAIFSLAFKLALPFVVAEFAVEVALGILMRVIPQIHVFVISMQMRLLVGLMLMIAFAHPVSAFIDKYMMLMLENTVRVLQASMK